MDATQGGPTDLLPRTTGILAGAHDGPPRSSFGLIGFKSGSLAAATPSATSQKPTVVGSL